MRSLLLLPLLAGLVITQTGLHSGPSPSQASTELALSFPDHGGINPGGTISTSGSTTGTTQPYDTTYVPYTFDVTTGTEAKSLTSYRNSSGSVVSDLRHVLQITGAISGTGWASGRPNDPQSDFYNSYASQRSTGITGSINLTSSYPPSNPYNPGDGHNYSSGPTGEITQKVTNLHDVRPGGSENTLYLVSPGEFGQSGSQAGNVPTSSSTTAAGLYYLPASGTYNFNLASPDTLSAGTLTVVFKTRKWWHTLEYAYNTYTQLASPPAPPNTWSYNTTWYFWRYHEQCDYTKYTFTISKDLCEDAAVDSRKEYGQPNVDGQVIADPNTELRNPYFGEWFYKGGLFMGNMPASTGDASGTARVQLYPSGTQWSSGSKFAIVSLLYLGKPVTPSSGDISVTALTASISDPNFNVPWDQVTWANKWDTWVSVGRAKTLTDATPVNDYCTWISQSSRVTQNAVIKMTNEDPAVTAWRYFASKEYGQQFTTFPETDSQPRVWLVDLTGTTTWSTSI